MAHTVTVANFYFSRPIYEQICNNNKVYWGTENRSGLNQFNLINRKRNVNLSLKAIYREGFFLWKHVYSLYM